MTPSIAHSPTAPCTLVLLEQGTGALKAAAALDSFANVTYGFASLLIGDCFEDVIITTVSVSQADTPVSLRIPNSDTSSASYGDHVLEVEAVPSAVGLSMGGSHAFMWIVIFLVVLVLGTCLCTCVGVKCINNRAGAVPALLADDDDNDNDQMAKYVDGSALDALRATPRFSKENRMFSPNLAEGRAAPRVSAARKRAALNVNNVGRFNNSEMDDFEILSSPGETTLSEDSPIGGRNPMFTGMHAPRLSALDFGKTLEGDEDNSGQDREFWRPDDEGDDDDTR